MPDVIGEFGGLLQVTASGLVLIVVLMIFRGKLVPARYYDEMKTARDKLQVAVDTKEAIIAELVEQQKTLLAANMTTKRVIESLTPAKEE